MSVPFICPTSVPPTFMDLFFLLSNFSLGCGSYTHFLLCVLVDPGQFTALVLNVSFYKGLCSDKDKSHEDTYILSRFNFKNY